MNEFTQQHPPQPQGPQHAAQPPRGGGMSLVSAVIGGAIVAVVFAAMLVTGLIDGKETTVVQGGGVATRTTADGAVQTVGDIYKKTSPGVVSIRANVGGDSTDPFGSQSGVASGTGFVVSDDGYIVTNAHVVDKATGNIRVTFNDEKSINGKLVGADTSSDVAVVKVDPDDHKLTPLKLGNSEKVAVGEPVVAIGSPFGLDQTVTTGIVSAIGRAIDAPSGFAIDNVIQTDAAINPGNSGGPLLNGVGEVIGINSQIATSGQSQGNVGIGFAVPINRVKEVIPQLEKDGKVEYAFLGVTTTPLDSQIAERVNFDGRKTGAIVYCVVDDGPADKAGLSAGGSDKVTVDGAEFALDADLIVAIDGQEVKEPGDVQNVVIAKKPGDSIELKVIRDGDEETIKAKLGTRPTDSSNNNCSPTQQLEPQQP